MIIVEPNDWSVIVDDIGDPENIIDDLFEE